MRTKNSIRNIIVALAGQLIGILLSFVSRKVFIRVMSSTLLGVNSVFSNLLSVLSLAELGIGTAITFSLYRPLSENNELEIQAIMTFYKKMYRIIAVVVSLMGIAIMPFFPFIIKESVPNIYVYYVLYLSSTIISYLCAYKRTLIIADQKNYISSICRNIYLVLLNVLQIIVLIYTHSYVVFLVVQIILSFVENLAISKIADKIYPYIRKEGYELEKKEKEVIYKNIKALMMHRIGSVVVTNTTSMLLSAIVNIQAAAIYANYKLVYSGINTILTQLYTSLTASVGNLLIEADKEYSYKIYRTIIMVSYWIYGSVSICIYILLNELIQVWIGSIYVESTLYVFLLTASFLIIGVREPTNIFKNAYGLFWNDRYKAVAEAVLNLLLSFILGYKLGVIGVLLAPVISCLSVPFWIEPFVLYKYFFEKSLYKYFLIVLKYILMVLVVGALLNFVFSYFNAETWIGLFSKALVVFLAINFIFWCLLHRSLEYKILENKLKVMIKKIKK